MENGVIGSPSSQDANNCHHGVPPMMNGWIQQSALHYNQPCTSSHYQQQQQQQQLQQEQQSAYLHQITSGVMPMPCLPYQHQALMHQHSAHQYVMPSVASSQRNKYPGQQQLPTSNSMQHVTMQPTSRNFGQPVYANAPPKPRRLTDGSYSAAATPSPDSEYVKSPISPDYRPIAKSPISEYERSGSSLYGTKVTKPPMQQPSRPKKALLRTDRSGLNYGFAQQPAERRTPDTYGRSANSTINRANGDYEDVYNPPQLYQRPNGPSLVTTNKHWSDQQFARSASARLPRTRHPAAIDRECGDFMESTISHDTRDGERKIQQVT